MVKNTHLLNGYMLKVHIGIAYMMQFQCVPTTYVTEIKETYFEIYTIKTSIMSIVFTSFKHSKQPISIIIPVTLLQIVYICMTAIPPNSSS